MTTDKKLSSKIIRKIILMIIILLCLLTVGVVATKYNINYVTIKFDDSQITVMTSKTKVSEILEENKIVLLEDEYVYPSKEDDIDASKIITISKQEKKNIVVSEQTQNITTEQILGNYVTITEKIIVEQEEIPFETITKDISTSNTETSNKVVQEGQNGIKNVKYKVRYQNDEEIEKTFVSEEIIKVVFSSRMLYTKDNHNVTICTCHSFG